MGSKMCIRDRVMRRDLNTCSSQSAMHHGAPVRVFLRRLSEHHSRNDSSSSTSWSHDSHDFCHSRTLVVPGTFLRVLYKQHLSPCSFRERVGRKRKRHRAGPTSSTFRFSFSCGIVYSRGNRTPESEKKAGVGKCHQTQNEEENFGIRTRYVYIPFCRVAVNKKSSHRRGCGLPRCTSPKLLRPTALPHGSALHL